jgi:hypothetical protein
MEEQNKDEENGERVTNNILHYLQIVLKNFVCMWEQSNQKTYKI